jgi:hypothetical protein
MNPDSAAGSANEVEAEAVRSEDNGPLPPKKIAISGAIS